MYTIGIWRKKLSLLRRGIHVGTNDSLQKTINTSPNHSTIYVEPGSYSGDLYINKTLYIIGVKGITYTHIFGELTVVAPGVILQGLTFYPSVRTHTVLTIYDSAYIIGCRFVNSMESRHLYSPRPKIAIDCKHCPYLHTVNNEFSGWKQAMLLRSAENVKVRTNVFKSCQTAISALVVSTLEVARNLFFDNIASIEACPSSKFPEYAQNNTFSGNVIPMSCNSEEPYYPSESQASKPVLGSQSLYVTGECNNRVDNNNICSSIGVIKIPLGMF